MNAYSPTNTNGTVTQKDNFYRKLQKACTKDKTHKLIVGGDFNAISSVVLKQTFFNGKNFIDDPQCNDNGNRIKSFCRSKSLCMLQTYFDYPLEERFTWYSNDGITKRVLDYILVEEFVQQYADDCKVENHFDFKTDHKLLTVHFNTPKTKKHDGNQIGQG